MFDADEGGARQGGTHDTELADARPDVEHARRPRRIGTVVEGRWWNRTARPIYGRKIVAVAIRYRGERDRF